MFDRDGSVRGGLLGDGGGCAMTAAFTATLTPLVIVDQMVALFPTPDTFVKVVSAKDRDGRTVDASDPAACRFCLFGAKYNVGVRLREAVGLFSARIAIRDAMAAVESALRDEAVARGFKHYVIFSEDESTTHADILDFLRCVRARLERAKGLPE